MSAGCHLTLEFKKCIDIREDWSLLRIWQERTKSPFFASVSVTAWRGLLLVGTLELCGLGGYWREELCALRAPVNQTRNSWPATAVIQVSWGIFFNFMKMNMALKFPSDLGFLLIASIFMEDGKTMVGGYGVESVFRQVALA